MILERRLTDFIALSSSITLRLSGSPTQLNKGTTLNRVRCKRLFDSAAGLSRFPLGAESFKSRAKENYHKRFSEKDNR